MSNFEKALPVLTALVALPACSLSSDVDRDAWRAHENAMQAKARGAVHGWEADCAEAMDVARDAAFADGDAFTVSRMERDFAERISAEMELVEGMLDENDCWLKWNVVGCDVLNGRLEAINFPGTHIPKGPQVTCSTAPFKS